MPAPNPYAPPIADVSATAAEHEHEATRRRLIHTEANIRALGSLVVVGGVLSVPQGLSTMSATPVQGLVTLATLPIAIWAGLALRQLDAVGRTLYTVIAVLATLHVGWNVDVLAGPAPMPGPMAGMLGQLVVVGLSLALLWGKNAKEIFTEHYRRVVIPATPYVTHKTSGVVIALLVLLLAIFVATIAAHVASP